MANDIVTPTPIGTRLAAADIGGAKYAWVLLADATGADAVPQLLAALGAEAAASAPLAGVSTGKQVVGPFVPQLGRALTLRIDGLTGTTSGPVQLLRSSDGTAANAKPITALGTPIAIFTADCQELALYAETNPAATWWLSLPVAGITYRLAN